MVAAPGRTAAAAAAALVMATAPIFWGYGAMAGNYTAILAVGGFLLGVACRTWTSPEPWHPAAAAVVLALGTGYRPDIGTLWLPGLSCDHLETSLAAGGPGGAALHRAEPGVAAGHAARGRRLVAGSPRRTAEFAYHAGYLNSVWNLGLVNAPGCRQAGHGLALDARSVSPVRSPRYPPTCAGGRTADFSSSCSF